MTFRKVCVRRISLFPLPASFIWEMFVRVLPDIPKESAFSKQSMSWKLMTLLRSCWIRVCAPLRHYLTVLDTDKRKLSFQLSARAMTCSIIIWFIGLTGLRSGEAGRKTVEGLGRRKNWRGAPLWGKHWWNIPPRWGSRWHRANLCQRFIQALESATHTPGLPSRVFICGISALPAG